MQRITRATESRAARAPAATGSPTQGRLRAKRASLTAVLAICMALALVFSSGSALAKKTKKKTTTKKPVSTLISKGSDYLALGDSVTFGYQEPTVVPAPDYANAASFLGYPELLGSELHLTVANAACPGETSASFLNTSVQSNGCENTPGNPSQGYRVSFPLHVKYSGTQLAYALSYLKSHKHTKLVSLMIGANDYLLCQETTADKCSSLSEQAGVLTSISKNVATILSAIRKKAHYTGQLVVVNYYSLNYASAADNTQSAAGNSAVDGAAKPFGAVVADGYGLFQTAAAHSGNNTCTAGLLTQLSTPSGTCGIHPSYAGQALLAQSLEKVIKLG